MRALKTRLEILTRDQVPKSEGEGWKPSAAQFWVEIKCLGGGGGRIRKKQNAKPLTSPSPAALPPRPQSRLLRRAGAGGGNLCFYGFSFGVARLPGPAPCPALPQLRAPWRKAAQSPRLPLPAGHRASKRALSSGGGEASGPLEKNNTAPKSC